MITGFGASWTPDMPDSGLADSDALAEVAATEYDPAQDDHFDGIELCGAKFGTWFKDTRQYIDLVCGDDDGHYPETPHTAIVSWRDSPTDGLPAEPSCPDCADTGVHDGNPCSCNAGQPFRDALTVRAAAQNAVEAP
jgi:hypothetical protein